MRYETCLPGAGQTFAPLNTHTLIHTHVIAASEEDVRVVLHVLHPQHSQSHTHNKHDV